MYFVVKIREAFKNPLKVQIKCKILWKYLSVLFRLRTLNFCWKKYNLFWENIDMCAKVLLNLPLDFRGNITRKTFSGPKGGVIEICCSNLPVLNPTWIATFTFQLHDERLYPAECLDVGVPGGPPVRGPPPPRAPPPRGCTPAGGPPWTPSTSARSSAWVTPGNYNKNVKK